MFRSDLIQAKYSRYKSVDGIYAILSMIINISFLGLLTFLVLHILRNLKKRNLLEDIAKVEARLATLRLNLKARIKKKANRFRASYPQSIANGDPIDIATSKLMDISFEKNSDFQDYIDLCKKINSYIEIASIDIAPEKRAEFQNPAINSDIMGTDFKNEINIVRLINDMVSVSKVHCKMIAKYNNFDKKIKIPQKESINFTSLFELQKVFKNEDGASSEDKVSGSISNKNNAA